MASGRKTYPLIGADGKPHSTAVKGTIGGHRRTRIFGRLDCPTALRAIARCCYVRHRVFFAETGTVWKAGYRPCAVCMPDAYRVWKGAPN
jgi:methylphosphotriester-DNA--protein-cysteine methyltransferase